MRILILGVVCFGVIAVFAVSCGLASGQEPPVGNPPEPDDDLQHQIADFLMGSTTGAQSAGPVEEDPALWDLIRQQQPDLTVTLGGGAPVGGIAELPKAQGAQAQVTNWSSGPNRLFIVAVAVIGLLVLGALVWYTRRRLYLGILVVGLVTFGFFITPVHRGDAGFAACVLTARDVDITGPLNYLWYAAAACEGENWDKAHIFVDWQYYDWNTETWWDLECCIGSVGETNDEDIIAWGARNVPSASPPYTGLTCRRIEAFFWFEHSGRFQNFTLRSNGECY